MSDSWKQLDLEGAGLQTVNLKMTQALRKHRTAYLLWCLFPVGAHRVYLHSSTTSLIYTALTALGFILWLTLGPNGLWVWALELPFALFDLYWIDRRVTEMNKSLRMALYLQKDSTPPKGYRGRYVDENNLLGEYAKLKNDERVSDKRAFSQPEAPKSKHVPSFAEQEALLKEIAKQKRRTKDH